MLLITAARVLVVAGEQAAEEAETVSYSNHQTCCYSEAAVAAAYSTIIEADS